MDWKTAAIGGVVLGLLVVVWQFVSAAAGLQMLFPLVATALELAVQIGVLVRTRAQHAYVQQVAIGSGVAFVATPFILVGAVLVGAQPDEMAAGVFGTLFTGVFVALIASVFLRTKPA
ncbi:MAG: hypothetical protein H6737_12015 [Alphaproteobacteria bacterium]|nr:hypothetical protein [Alphaproteobacteria bacterium]